PEPPGGVPLHADPRLVAESGGVVLQRVGAAVVAAGELQVGGAVQRTAGALVGEYNARKAHPYRWTYTGEPLVRGTPFSQTRRQRRSGRAWFGRAPSPFERFLHPPRPYNRK